MKLLLSVLSLVSVIGYVEATASFQPYRIRYVDLINDDKVNSDNYNTGNKDLLNALTEIGMISITDLPQDAVTAMNNMMKLQHDCIMKSIDHEQGQGQEHVFIDGTIRRTVATHTVPGVGGMQSIIKKNDNAEVVSSSCEEFEQSAKVFRKTVHTTVEAFADRVTNLLPSTDKPLLQTKAIEGSNPDYAFNNFYDVVTNGEHLEHFHSYEKKKKNENENDGNGNGKNTIEFHTDQGLFLTFTPGRRVNVNGHGELTLTDGFHIQLNDGSIQNVQFTDDDQIVILLGDGVNQYINNNINQDNNNEVQLRAVPHALQLQSNEQPRVWYGRMVLPPALAVHPLHGKTFQELRQGLITSGPDHDDAVRLACSNDQVSASTFERLLQDTTCEFEEEIYCWHRCMNTTLFSVSDVQCDHTFQELQCINPRDQVWAGEKHGDYFPGCAETDAEIETDFPTLPEFPRDDSICNNFNSFVEKAAPAHENIILLQGDASGTANNATFQYTVNDDGSIRGRIAFDGIFGYLAIGLAGVGGKHAMFNAHILMALRGGDYSARNGMDLDSESSVEEYIIHPSETTFRIWGTPYMGSSTTATQRNAGRHHRELAKGTVEFDDECYTALMFELDGFAGQTFNIEGTDNMIWAANNVDTYVQYHGANRGKFSVTWKSDDNKVIDEGTDSTPAPAPGDTPGETEDKGASGAFLSMTMNLTSIAVMAMTIIFFILDN